jgi:hypothetical protein
MSMSLTLSLSCFLQTYTVGLNFLADHLPMELDARRGKLRTKKGAKPNSAAGYHLRNYYDADLPDEVDWRQKGAVNPPQDQGSQYHRHTIAQMCSSRECAAAAAG